MLLGVLLFAGVIVTYLANMVLTPSIMTPRKYVREILELMQLKKGMRLIDLGSGDGRVIIQAMKSYKVKVVGYEISPILAMYSRILKLIRAGLSGSFEIKSDSLFRSNLNQIDVVYCHLNDRAMKPLLKKLSQDLPDKASVFSYQYKLPGIKEDSSHTLSNGNLVYQYSSQTVKKKA